MLHSHNKINIPDQNNKNDLVLEVNYFKSIRSEKEDTEARNADKPDDEKGEYDEVIRASIGDKTAYIRVSDLYSFLLVAGTATQQTSLIPVTSTEMMIYEQMHIIEAKKDIKKGETIRAHCRMKVPIAIHQGLQRDIVNASKNVTLGGMKLIA